MKGTPLLRALLLLGTLLLLAWPLSRVTHPPELEKSSRDTPTSPTSPASLQKLSLTLNFTRDATKIELLHLGKGVWAKDHPERKETLELPLPFPPEGIELAVRVHWPGTELAALRLLLTTPEGTELERSAWGTETLEAVLSFP